MDPPCLKKSKSNEALISCALEEATGLLKTIAHLEVNIEESDEQNESGASEVSEDESNWSCEDDSDSYADEDAAEEREMHATIGIDNSNNRKKGARTAKRKHAHGSHTEIDNDEAAVKLILANLRSRFLSLSLGTGSKSKEAVVILDCVAAAAMSEEIVTNRLQSAVTRVLGITRQQQTRGLALLRENSTEGNLQLCIPRQAHSYGKKAKKDLDFVYRWFHEDCDLVEIDKSRRNAYSRKLAKVAGKQRRLTCQRRIMNATKTQLAQNFLESATYATWTQTHPGMALQIRTVRACICPCMKEATLTECACPCCVEFRYLIKAWREQRKQWHSVPCTCDGCTGPKFSAYWEASSSTSAFLAALLCPRQKYAHLALPHMPDEIPEFFALSCCMKNSGCPPHCTPCNRCGWDQKFYRFFDCVERTDGPATWMKWQDTALRSKKDIRPVLREHHGTREELIDSIILKSRGFAYHRWINYMASHQEKLDVQTFDGTEEIIMKTDFAAGTHPVQPTYNFV